MEVLPPVEATEFHTKAFKYVQTYKHTFIFLISENKGTEDYSPSRGWLYSAWNQKQFVNCRELHFPGKNKHSERPRSKGM